MASRIVEFFGYSPNDRFAVAVTARGGQRCPFYDKIRERLGGNLLDHTPQSGALTLMWYDVGPPVPEGQARDLSLQGTFTTTVDQVALAFTSPGNLPEANVYEAAIRAELG